jgi:hypothetical protein
VLLVPSERVYFHVGGHKTGTTFLQNVLWHNRVALRRDGLLYPGGRRNAHIWANHDLRGTSFKGYRAPQVEGAWRRLVDDIQAYDRSAVIDHEMFSLATERNIARAMRDLSFAEVHIVFTARDMARQLPAAWQEWVKNRETMPFAQFLDAVRREGPASVRLRAMHDVPAILAKWSAGIPPERVHIVTVPPPGADPGLLWRRFAQVLGIDPVRYPTDVPEANTSLGATEVSVIRRLNALLADVPQPQYDRAVKFHLAPELAKRRGTKIELPQDAFDWAVEQAQRAVGGLRTAGYDVVGALDELLPAQRPAGADPDAAAPAEQADAAIEGLAALVRLPEPQARPGSEAEVRELRTRLAAAEGRLRELDELSPRQRLRHTAAVLSRQVGWLGAARRGAARLRRSRS